MLQFSSPIDFEDISTESLAELIKSKAINSFGITFSKDSFTFQLKALIQQINFIESQVKNTENKINRLISFIDSPITTIPDIGNVIGATTLGEIGDINKFDSPKKIVAYAGIDAIVISSGEFQATHTVMSKSGSPYLRKALFQAALVASFNNPVLNAYYLKKRGGGKHLLTCIGAVSRKLCNIIYAILRD